MRLFRRKTVGAAHGGITQLVEYPVHTRYVICSNQIAATRPVGQVVKTPPFHGGNMGSSPVRVTTTKTTFVFWTNVVFFKRRVRFCTQRLLPR